MAVTKDEILAALRGLGSPELPGGDIVSLGLVSDVFVADGKVFFSITVPAERARGTGAAARGRREGGEGRRRASHAPWWR